MTMEVIDERTPDNNDVIKKMSEMKHGEVCHCADVGYILRIGDDKATLFLILEEEDDCDYYAHESGDNIDVRELYRDETITIRFS